MKKRVRVKRNTKKRGKLDIKETLAFKLLIISIILLFFLVIVWLVVYQPSEAVGEDGEGLGTLRWGVEADSIDLMVINYQLQNNNESMDVEIYRDLGVGDIGQINFTFNRSEGECSYIEYNNFPSELESRSYYINVDQTNCGPSNFTNVSNVTLAAGVNVYKEVYFPENCNANNLTAVWNSVFTESSSGITKRNDTPYRGLENSCGEYFIYKLNGNIAYLIYAINTNESYDYYVLEEFYAVKANVTNSILTDILGVSTPYEGYVILRYLEDESGVQGQRNIINGWDAITEFEKTFWDDVYNTYNWWSWSAQAKNYDGVQTINYRDSYTLQATTEKYKNIYFEREMLGPKELDYFHKRTVHAELTNLTLIDGGFEDIIIYKDEGNFTPSIELDDHFTCLIDDLSFGVWDYGWIDNTNITHEINDSDDTVIFRIPNGEYGTKTYGVQVDCGYNGQIWWGSEPNLIFNVTFLNQNRPPSNYLPDFDNDCDDLLWNRNTSRTLNMSECWDDDDDDSLTLRYENRSNGNPNLTISVSNNVLTLTPDTNWVGMGYFYVYADDGKDEQGERIDFTVRIPPTSGGDDDDDDDNNGDGGNGDDDNTTTTTKIKTSGPSGAQINLVPGDNETFSITAEGYDTIKWYVDGVIVKTGGLDYDFGSLEEGSYTLKVEIINGTQIDAKTWNVVIAKEESPLDVGNIVFYMIIVVLMIIILLVVWLFVIEKSKKGREITTGFGISGGGEVGKVTPTGQFKSPKR